mmetsp:Transcript_15852/g.26350  ORF Transcript_15852/g.26350 Transcript_15852/m.26350 type:complete len:327 (+) Transcript_15852:165-1145(+)
MTDEEDAMSLLTNDTAELSMCAFSDDTLGTASEFDAYSTTFHTQCKAEQETVRILNYGSSQAEVFDYVFHGTPGYHRYEAESGTCQVGWRSGWSTRGLGQAAHVARLTEPLARLDSHVRHAFVLLSFGSVDIEWNLSYKRDVLKQDVDTAAFIEEMICALESTVDKIVAQSKLLIERGGPEVHIVLGFPYIPLPLSDNYLQVFDAKYGGGSYRVISHDERCKLWHKFCDSSQQRIIAKHPDVQVVDIRQEFKEQGFAAFMRSPTDEEDHHPDLAKTQHAVAAKVRALRFSTYDGSTVGMEPSLWPHQVMYEHKRRRFPAENDSSIK